MPGGGGGGSVAEAGLGLEHLASIDEMRGDAMPEAVQGRVGYPGRPAEATELVGQESAVTYVSRSGPGVKIQSACGDGPRFVHNEKCAWTSSAVVEPRVRRRVQLDLVEPNTPWERPRSIVGTLPSRSPWRRTANSPRPAPESAARRTSKRACSALNSSRRHRSDPGSQLSSRLAFPTAASAVRSSWRASATVW